MICPSDFFRQNCTAPTVPGKGKGVAVDLIHLPASRAVCRQFCSSAMQAFASLHFYPAA